MAKRSIFLHVFMLLVLAPGAFSIYEELLFSDTVEDGDAVNISGREFEFRVDSQSNKVLINIDVSGIIVESGSCEIKDKLHICVKNVSFSYRNYDPWYDIYKAEVEVYQIKASLDTTHTIEKEAILIDEETTATLAFENTADVSAENVIAAMQIPSNIEIVEIEGCKKTFDSIVFEGIVSPRQTRTCTYKLKGLYAGDYELKANISYFDGVENQVTVSGAIEGKVHNYSLAIGYNTNKSTFDILEKFSLDVVLKNTNDEHDLSVTTLSLRIPERVILIKKPKEFTGTDKLLSWSGPLKVGENKSFNLELQGLVTGNYPLAAEASYKIGKFLRKTLENFGVNIDCDCPYIEHDFSQNIVTAAQRAVLIADLVNPGSNSFRNVKVSYITDVPGIEPYSTVHGSIEAGQRIRVFDSSVISPELGQLYYLNVTAVYESSAGEIFIRKESIPIGVKIEEDEAEDIQQAENQSEEKKEENITTVSGAIGETGNGEEESSKEGESEGIPVTTIQDEKKAPLGAFAVIAFVFGLILLLIFLIKLRRKKKEVDTKEPEALGKGKSQAMKGFLFSTSTKKEDKESRNQHIREETEYRDLAKQVRELGNVMEEDMEAKKRRFLGRIFRRK